MVTKITNPLRSPKAVLPLKASPRKGLHKPTLSAPPRSPSYDGSSSAKRRVGYALSESDEKVPTSAHNFNNNNNNTFTGLGSSTGGTISVVAAVPRKSPAMLTKSPSQAIPKLLFSEELLERKVNQEDVVKEVKFGVLCWGRKILFLGIYILFPLSFSAYRSSRQKRKARYGSWLT